MSSLLYGEVANRIGRVILQDLIGFLGERYAHQDPAKMTPLTILIDEFSNVAYPGFIDALNKGGGAKANIMLAMQSLADPEAAMGRDGTQRVLDNLNTRIWFRLTDDATAKLAVEGLGMASIGREDISHSLSFGGSSGTSGGARGVMQYADRSLVRSEWVTGLPRGEAFVRTRGENWKLRVPLLRPVTKNEMKKVAEHFKLERVLTEFKELAERQRKKTVNEELLSGRTNGQARDGGKDAGGEKAGNSADGGGESAVGRGLKGGMGLFGAAVKEEANGADEGAAGASAQPVGGEEEAAGTEASEVPGGHSDGETDGGVEKAGNSADGGRESAVGRGLKGGMSLFGAAAEGEATGADEGAAGHSVTKA